MEWRGLASRSYKPKTIILFGDIHEVYGPCRPCARPQCLKFPEFIKTLLREASQCIDVFIEEFPYYGKTKGAYRRYRGAKGSIGYTRYKLRKYRATKKNRKVFRYGRLHLTDLRTGGLSLAIKDIVLGSQSPDQAIRRLYRFYGGIMKGTLKTRDPAAQRIVKQVAAMPTDLRKLLTEAFMSPSTFPFSIDPFPRLWKTSSKYWEKARRDLAKDESSRPGRVMTGMCLSPLFDIYTLARMFKPVFRSSRVAIVYSGATHTARMIYFLKHKLGASLTYLEPKLEKGLHNREPQCIKVEGGLKNALHDIIQKRREPCKISRHVFGKGEVSTPQRPQHKYPPSKGKTKIYRGNSPHTIPP